MTDDRRADAQKKISLGGLVIKAKMQDLPKAVILGTLLDGLQRIRDKAERERLTALGHRSLAGLDDK